MQNVGNPPISNITGRAASVWFAPPRRAGGRRTKLAAAKPGEIVRPVDANRPLGLVLAGGLARRMGGADKAMLTLGGKPLIAHALDALEPQCAALAINANGDPRRFARFALPCLADEPQNFAGPLAGVLAGLQYGRRQRPEVADVLTLPVDTPFAPPDLVARLQAARRAAGKPIAVAASGGRRHFVVALWPVALAGALRAHLAQGGRQVELFAERHGAASAEWPNAPFDPFFNINTTEDLQAAEARLAVGA